METKWVQTSQMGLKPTTKEKKTHLGPKTIMGGGKKVGPKLRPADHLRPFLFTM